MDRKLANGQNIDYSEKRRWPKGFICPCTGVKYHNIQTCKSQVSIYRTIGPLVIQGTIGPLVIQAGTIKYENRKSHSSSSSSG